MSDPISKELEDLWAGYEVARAAYKDALHKASIEAKTAATPLLDAMREAYEAYHNRSNYYGGRE
jgi:hypothetical protein